MEIYPLQLLLQIPKLMVTRISILDVTMLRLTQLVMLRDVFLPSSHKSLHRGWKVKASKVYKKIKVA